MIARFNENNNIWIITNIVNFEHNYCEEFENIMFKYRKYAMIDKIKKYI